MESYGIPFRGYSSEENTVKTIIIKSGGWASFFRPAAR